DYYASRGLGDVNKRQEPAPSFGPTLDDAVSVHLDGLAAAVRGTVDWTLESARYPVTPAS
ncbi:hypothetical protein DLJ57_07850, partial [Micromonospora chalcea]